MSASDPGWDGVAVTIRAIVAHHLASRTARPIYLAAIVRRHVAADPSLAPLLDALHVDDVATARRLCGEVATG